MTATAGVAFTLFLLKDDNLAAAFVFNEGRFDHCAFDEWLAQLKAFAFTYGEDFADLERCACFGFGVAVQNENVALLYCELFALGLDSCFH